MPESDVLRLYDFSGGLNEKQHDYLLADNETPSCQNVVLEKTGAIKKRNGYTSILNEKLGENPIIGVYIFMREDSNNIILTVDKEKIYEINESANSSTEIHTFENEIDYVSFATWQDTCYISTGNNPLLEHDGTDITENTNAPEGKYIISFENRLFITGDTGHPNRIYYSELADPDDWTGDNEITNNIEIQTDTGDFIQQIIKLRDQIVIFRLSSIFMLFGNGPQNFELKEVDNNIGTFSPKSVATSRGLVLFLSKDGIYYFDGSNMELISVNVEPTVFNISNQDNVCGIVDGNRYYLSYNDGIDSKNKKVLVYDFVHKAWTKFDNIFAASYFPSARQRAHIYFGSSKEGMLYKMGSYSTDDGENIQMRYDTKYFNFGASEIIKTFRKMLIESDLERKIKVIVDVDKGRNTVSIDVEPMGVIPENMWGNNTWEELIWGAYTGSSFGTSLPGSFFGRSVKFSFVDETDLSPTISGLLVKYTLRRERFVGG